MITFRRPLPEEAADLAALHVQCWREAYGAIVPPDLAERFDAKAMVGRWQDLLATPDRYICAAYEKSLPVAFVNSGRPHDKIHESVDGHIAALYVLQAHYRQGLGRRLVSLAALDWLEQGGHSISLGVLAANSRARAFYEALGGRTVKTGFYNWHGHELPDVIYVFEDLRKLAMLQY